MKYIIAFFIFGIASCSNPYTHPQTSMAKSEKELVEVMNKQNQLLEKQNQYLERIARALEAKNK